MAQAQFPSRKCDACKGETIYTASVHCEECEQSLCKGCNDFHDRFCKDHHVFDINKAGNRVFKAKPVCEFHKKRFLFFCNKCKCLTCDECMTKSHNGHKTDTIKKIVNVYRVNAKETHDKLKAKVDIVQRTLETIKTKQTQQITSDFDSYVLKVEKTCRDMYGIVVRKKKLHMTAASDFQTIEKQELDRKRVFFQRQYDESSGTFIQIDNLLQEKHDVTFFTDWKRLQTDVQNMIEIDQPLQNPRRIESFNEDDFMKAVMEEINKRLKRSLIKENETEIELLTTAVKKKETLACKLQEENNILNKILKKKQAEIDKLSRQSHGWSTTNPQTQYCAAIDIGSTYSGYAFGSKNDYMDKPPKFSMYPWQGSQLLTLKAPTSVLLDSNQELVAFGFEAENMYSELFSNAAHEDYYYFHRFKMLLDNRGITTKTLIKDEAGKQMEALTVFHLTIKYLKDHMYTKITKRVKDIDTQICVFYVFTVPANWDYLAVEIMREAAIKAGIDSRQLTIVSEPEAASKFCQVVNLHLHDTQQNDSFETQFKSGKMFMMVDLGGGSADITVHQKDIYNGLLREVIPPNCGPWGGKSIDDRFYIFLSEIVGADVMEEFKKTELEDFIDLFRHFENKKRSIRTNQTHKVVLLLPVALTELVKRRWQKVEIAVDKSPYRDSVIYNKQKIHMLPDIFIDLFKPTIESLVDHLEAMLRQAELHDLKTIVLVGGFSECELIQDKVRARFGRNITIIIPEEAGLAVLKGAVLYGHSINQ